MGRDIVLIVCVCVCVCARARVCVRILTGKASVLKDGEGQGIEGGTNGSD